MNLLVKHGDCSCVNAKSVACAIAILALFASANAKNVMGQTTDRPNVLLIMADDLGFSDLGCYGSEIQTPNLDTLAGNGLRFTQFYNTARCWPTRGSLLTGYYAQQIRRDALAGIPSGGGNRGKRPEWAFLAPRLLQPAGYRSYHTGKWHIDGMPIQNGFDRSYYLKDQGRFFNPKRHFKDDKALPAVEKGTDFYATTVLADHAIEVLKEHQTEYAKQPFFHYLAFAAPHFPLHALPQDIAVYEDTYDAGWDAIRAQRWKRQIKLGIAESAGVNQLSRVESRLGPPYHFADAFEKLGPAEVNKPISWKNLNDEQKQFQANKMAIHAAMIHRMDIEIGRVFQQIKDMGQWENTLVIFLSDNGASAEIMVRDDGHDPSLPPGSAGTYLCLGPGWSTVANTPFRRHKTWTHEGGTSTPLIMAWPNGIAGKGEFRNTPGHVIDIVPTILDLVDLKPGQAADQPAFPGVSMVDLFSKSTEDPQRLERPIWWFHDGNKAIRQGDWKAVAPVGEPWELYNLKVDRDESSDLAIAEHEKLAELVSEWNRMTNEFTETASRDLSPAALEKANKAQRKSNASSPMKKAQADAKPKRQQVLLNGKSFLLNDRHTFVMQPKQQPDENKPWIFYGPTLPRTPDKAETSMHERFLAAGVAVAGIDVGEGYGSPHALRHFDALHKHMVSNGYSAKPALLGRRRGGLWVSSWAIANPDKVAGIGGIYPVYDLSTYPGFDRAASVYRLSAKELERRQSEFNPIKSAAVLAKAKIPVFIIHGNDDNVVPIKENSATLETIYEEQGASQHFDLIRIDDQGHNYWRGFFECQPLVDFLIRNAKGDQP